MNPGRLLQHYERIADAPDAIVRLRRFILNLAVRGKLVPQDPKDEPASELLKRIAKDRARLVEVGKIREIKPVAMLPKPGVEVPRGWQAVPLGDVINSHLGGGTPSKNNSAYWDGNIRWASVKDVGKLKYLDETIDRISEEGLANSSSNLIPAGNLIVVTRMGLGQLSINRVPVAINQDLRALFLSDFVDIEYVYNFFLTHGMEGTGLTVKGIKIEELLGIPFLLPPLAEQHRIVAKVDELMALCDQLEAARTAREQARDRLAAANFARLNAPDPETFQADARFALNALPALTTRPDQIKQLRQTILNLAVRGKLVPQDPNDEPASELLKRIAAEKARLVTDRQIRHREIQPPIAVDEEPFVVPRSWIWTRLGTLCFLITDGAHHTPKYQDAGVPFLSVKDVSGGIIDFSNTRFISPEAHRELTKRCNPEFGDILLTKVGTTGIAVEVDTEQEFSIFVSLALLKFSRENVDRRFLCHLINSPFVKQQSADNTQGIGNKNLVLRLIKQFAIPIPPFAEQRRIVAKVDALMALCDQLEASLTATSATRRRLLDALLAEALAPAEQTSVPRKTENVA